jgi:dTDP-4-dehydrorhamnose 3,5-epimerase
VLAAGGMCRIPDYCNGQHGSSYCGCIPFTPFLQDNSVLGETKLRDNTLPAIPIEGCTPLCVTVNADHRGCLFEIFREEWAGTFRTVQWNACMSRAGVMRGAHVHIGYDEFYTLPFGRVFVALRDIRRTSPTFAKSVGFEWSAADGFAVPVPAGVAHAVLFLEDSVLAFALSNYWKSELDAIGCRWDDLDPSLRWPTGSATLSNRDTEAGSFADMLIKYETLSARLNA